MLADILNEVDAFTSVYVDCPFCGGRKSFGITHTGDRIIYNCFKLYCRGSRGVKPIHLSPKVRQDLATKQPAKKDFEKPVSWTTDVYGDDAYAYMQKVHILDIVIAGKFKPQYDIALQRFVYPIYGEYGKIEGGVGRALGKTKPKVWNYHSACARPFVCGTGGKIVLVEDCASAVSVTRLPDVTGIALLGTTLRDSYIAYIKELSPAEIYVALDADAKQKTLTICRRLSNIFSNVKPVFLEKDIKDMETLEGLL